MTYPAVIIDGSTQPGYAGAPLIEVDGSGAGPNADGISAGLGGGITVRALVINRFSRHGLFLNGVANHAESNFIGTDASGNVDLGNAGNGVTLDGRGSTRSGCAVVRGLRRGVAMPAPGTDPRTPLRGARPLRRIYRQGAHARPRRRFSLVGCYSSH